MPELPVAAPDPAATARRAAQWVEDRGVYLTPRGGLSPLPPGGADTRVVYAYADAFALALVALLAERQQDKERIERLEKTRKDAVDRLLSDPGQAAIAAVDGLRKILPQLKIEEDEQIRLILNWIGVAGDDNLSLAERVRFLALELATRQGYTFEEADRLAPPAFPAALAVEEDAPHG